MKHTSYKGRLIDMDMIKFQNQDKVALGNANMNARGDILGAGGTIKKTREELLAERERELQKPDIVPEHVYKPKAPVVDDGFDDSQFEIPEEPVKPKAAPRRPRTKGE